MGLNKYEWIALIVLVIGFIFFVNMGIQSLGKLGKHLDENGGMKAVIDQVWCGNDGCPEKGRTK